jgi:hypothetical protein
MQRQIDSSQTESEHFAIKDEIPISSTHTALVWRSVETEEEEIKKFKIRNTSNNEVKVEVEICDDSKSFKVLHIHIFFTYKEKRNYGIYIIKYLYIVPRG